MVGFVRSGHNKYDFAYLLILGANTDSSRISKMYSQKSLYARTVFLENDQRMGNKRMLTFHGHHSPKSRCYTRIYTEDKIISMSVSLKFLLKRNLRHGSNSIFTKHAESIQR